MAKLPGNRLRGRYKIVKEFEFLCVYVLVCAYEFMFRLSFLCLSAILFALSCFSASLSFRDPVALSHCLSVFLLLCASLCLSVPVCVFLRLSMSVCVSLRLSVSGLSCLLVVVRVFARGGDRDFIS